MSSMTFKTSCLAAVVALFATAGCQHSEFRIKPYLQNPAPDSMSIIWFSDDPHPGTVIVTGPEGRRRFRSEVEPAPALAYDPAELEKLPEGANTQTPYRHRVRVGVLTRDTRYAYEVRHAGNRYTGEFESAPVGDAAVRFLVYSDSETEPESTGAARRWSEPFGDKKRRYLVDQTEGYKQNLNVMASRRPDFIVIAGDLVQSGGEQRDWDEFWRHNAGDLGQIASSIPILPVIGNHDLHGGPGALGEFTLAAVRRAVSKYRTYFEVPGSDVAIPAHDQRYYRINYGPITLITLDSCNGKPHGSQTDSNLHMPAPGEEPQEARCADFLDFNPGSPQYEWLERQLADAQRSSRFTFVQFHHMPYSVGPHGFPPGMGNRQDSQSGQPLRVLTPLFERYGVDAVFCGHDETYEHAAVPGEEILPDGEHRAHTVHFYDLGMGGDGLRGPSLGPDTKNDDLTNEYQVFLAHLNAPEKWDGKRLVEGGKHYGHLEVNVSEAADGTWQAELSTAYVFPLMDENGTITGWERRTYDDVTVIRQQ